MKKLTLGISEPCRQNWNQMTPEEKGRFCASCKKQVVDFTTMSDRQLVSYFQKAQSGQCGRFYTDQLNRELSIPKKPLPWLNYFFTITWPALLLLLKSCGQKNEIVGELQFRNEAALTEPESVKRTATTVLMGDTVVVEPPLAVLPMRRIERSDVEAAPYRVKNEKLMPPVSAVCVEKRTLPDLPNVEDKASVATETSSQINELRGTIMGGISIRRPSDAKQRSSTPNQSSISVKPAGKAAATAYPSPVQAGQLLTVKLNRTFNGRYQVLNIAGQVMVTARLIVGREQAFAVPVPLVPAGGYFLRLLDEPTGEMETIKILVR